ncbi:MAG: menaquinone biosynthetic enzyme MqnA/MqnD family protein [Bacillota bacterium]
MNTPRLGRISFINCIPVYQGIESGIIRTAAAIKPHPPSQLNRLLAAGELDITPVSSIAYARHRDVCIALPDLSISADGQVMSVLLISKVPIHQLDGQTVSLTPFSDTSVVLLRILLEKFLGLKGEYQVRSADQDPLEGSQAGLVIGDEALLYRKQPGLYVYDLAAEWQKHTGQAMVFALWVVRREFAHSHHAQVLSLWSDLLASRAWGEAHRAQLVRRAQQETGLDSGLLKHYFEVLQFSLTPRHQAGLLHFYRCAWEIGLLSEQVNLEIWRETGVPCHLEQSIGRRAAN